MDSGFADVLSAIITAIAGFIAIFITARVNKAEKSVSKAEKTIEKVSRDLPSWTLLFEHDENGNPIKGSINDLIEAVEKGYPIKIRISKSQVFEAQWLYVENGIVYATNTNQISLTRNDKGEFVYQKKSYHYFVVVGSNGHHHATRVDLEGKMLNPTNSKVPMSWIGLIPPGISS